MKKLILLIVCLYCTLSCNNSVTGNIDEIETLLANEKRTPAQPKKYNDDTFTVSITTDKVDTRSIGEMLKNLPPKYEIINTVLCVCDRLWDGYLPYFPEVEIKKIYGKIPIKCLLCYLQK